MNRIWANLDGVMGNEIGEEIRGIAAYWDIDVGIILGMNILYEERKVKFYKLVFASVQQLKCYFI